VRYSIHIALPYIHLLNLHLDSGSQEERISMLKMALLEKGVVTGSHYGVDESGSTNPSLNVSTSTPLGNQTSADDDGVYL